jgi:hypothetical protein
MEIFDGYKLRQAIEAFGFDVKCSDPLKDWYLTVGDNAIFLNWEVSRDSLIDLYLEKNRTHSIDFFVGDLDLSAIDSELQVYAPWLHFEMIDLWELAEVAKRCEKWHVRCMLYVQDSPHAPTLFE